MIHTTNDFFNNVANEIRAKYFANVGYYGECRKAIYAIELFNNGCLTYVQLVQKLAKYCKEGTIEIHGIVEKHIVSFGSYSPKFRKKALPR